MRVNRSSSGWIARVLRPAAALVVVAALPAVASARDTVWLPGLERKGLLVTDIKDGKIHIKVITDGRLDTIELERATKMRIEGEVPFNAAEEAFEKKDYATALAQYQRAITATGKPFLKTRAVARMLEAAGHTKQFEAQVTAWAEFAKIDPASAATKKPVLVADKAKLNAVVPTLERAAADRPNDVLRGFIVELALAIPNIELAKKYGGGGTTTVAPPIPGRDDTKTEDMSAQAAGRINQAKIALATKNYAGVLAAIEGGGGRAAFTKPDQQFEALTLLAEARGGSARDPATWHEAAVAYMRVVSHAAALGKGNDADVADAMYKAATIIETKLNQPKEAMTLYNAVANDPRWKGAPQAAEAAKAVARLRGAAAAQ